MSTLYLECQSGISGDMTVAALLDLGADEKALRAGLESLDVDGYEIAVSKIKKNGIAACDFDVILEHPAHSHESHHDHPHHGHGHGCCGGKGHGKGQGRGCGRHHGHDHGEEGHSHHHDHPHEESGQPHSQNHGGEHTHSHQHAHAHRTLGDIVEIIERSAITPGAKATAIKIFTVVAEAEGAVHSLPLDQVHFHEVGAVDSIVDIVGAAICLDNLGIDRVICSPLREGTGTVRCQHGVMPIPAPATLEIVRSHNIPLVITDLQGELVTPTGAAIAAAVTDSFNRPRNMQVRATGYGAGKRNYPHTANLLRASLIEEGLDPVSDEVVKLECNLDDMTGEALAYACELLLETGVLDVWCTPIYMKKGRPAQLLSVLLPPQLEEAVTDLLLHHTSTIGVRVSRHTRHIMQRRPVQLSTPYGQVDAKESTRGGLCKIQVEYESAKALAHSQNLPINEILSLAYSKQK